ncbi:MAG: hypothetical protein Q8M15_08335 [Bacteroidota bacterium]|nr:hypothetical protein [Bacteroidota bacterium]
MYKNLLWIFCLACLFLTCKKEEPVSAVVNYKLGGTYVRDSAVYPSTYTGLKKLNLTPEGNYCWTTVVFGEDSSFCQGTYKQLTDSTLLWENAMTIKFKITPVDTLPNGSVNPKPKGMFLQLDASPPVAVLFGYYQ